MADRYPRRDFLKGGAALLAGGALAGCTGDGSPATEGSEPTDAGTGTAGAGGSTGTTESGGPHSASMSPMGEVEFDAVPESAFVIFPQYADMAVALGHGDAVNSVYVPKMSGTTMNHYYDRLEGVSFDWQGLKDPLADGLSKELLYELDSDVHLADPAYVSTQKNWSGDDVSAIATQVGPWFGNFYSGTHASPPDGYPDYEYYDLWEIFGRVAEVFRETERYDALAAVHDDLLSTIESTLPPKAERPSAVRVTLSQGKFYTYHLNEPGYWLADTRPLAANDAFEGKEWSNLWGTVDYETMLEADPDVILHLWGATPNYDMAEVRKQLRNHSVGKELTAVKNDRVYAQGMRYQGPIMNLFQLEMTAKQLYPEQFGEWPGYVDGEPYPEIPKEERLFDRGRVADAVNGEF